MDRQLRAGEQPHCPYLLRDAPKLFLKRLAYTEGDEPQCRLCWKDWNLFPGHPK